VSGGGHDDRSRDLSEVVGSERPATDVGTHQLPLGKSAMLFAGGTDHPISPFHLDHFGLGALYLIPYPGQLADLLDVIIVLIIRDRPRLPPTSRTSGAI